MSQDIVADSINQMMNAKRAGKTSLITHRYSKVLLSILALAKLKGYVKKYEVKDKVLSIEIGNLTGAKAIKPRYTVSVSQIEKYRKRYLPAKNIGILIISTSKGLMTHHVAEEKNLGGSLIAYLF
jgi:small subunit ribosomal protein S8